MKTSILIWILLLASPLLLIAQDYSVRGMVIDPTNKKPVAFAHVQSQQGKKGVITDVDGHFKLPLNQINDTVLVSFLGYHIAKQAVTSGTQIIIYLHSKVEQLEEVLVLPRENPAHAIIKKVLANKRQNDPEALNSFQYTSYQKFYITLEDPDNTLSEDTSRTAQFLKKSHVFMSESVTNKQFLFPNRSKEEVLATRVSGYSNPIFSMLVTDLQPFGFYKEHLFLLDKEYLNPISKGSTSRYDFILEDSLADQNHWIYRISFEPKRSSNFNGLRGILYIHSQAYAIRNVIAEMADLDAKVKIKIQQQYEQMDGRWFPTQLYADLLFNEYKFGKYRMMGIGRSYLTNIELDQPLDKRSFNHYGVELRPDAAKKSEEFWNHYRVDSLNKQELGTYQFLDSIGKKANLDRWMSAIQAVSTRRWTLKGSGVDMNLEHLLKYNQYEGTRIGLALETNQKFSKWGQLGAHTAYGFKDRAFKYGAHAQINWKTELDFFTRLDYQQDLLEVGEEWHSRNLPIMPEMAYRNWLISRMDSVQAWQLSTWLRPFRNGWQVALAAKNMDRNPTYDYQFQTETNEALHGYRQQEASMAWHYHHKERYMKVGGYSIFSGFELPSFSVQLAYGQTPLGDYQKVIINTENQLKTRAWGTSMVGLKAGMIEGKVPFGLLFTGFGANARSNIFMIPNHFQTMGMYEFASDRFAQLFLSHNFGKLWTTKRSRPELVLAHNAAIGSLSNTEAHQGIAINTLEQGYTEAGASLLNLLRFNYIDVGWLGIGGGTFYRYGNYAFPRINENLVYRISVTFGF